MEGSELYTNRIPKYDCRIGKFDSLNRFNSLIGKSDFIPRRELVSPRYRDCMCDIISIINGYIYSVYRETAPKRKKRSQNRRDRVTFLDDDEIKNPYRIEPNDENIMLVAKLFT